MNHTWECLSPEWPGLAAVGGGGGGGGGEAGDWDAWVRGLGPLLEEHASTATDMQLISAIMHIRAAPLKVRAIGDDICNIKDNCLMTLFECLSV